MKTLIEVQEEQIARRLRGHRARMLKFAELTKSGTAKAVSEQSLELALQDAAKFAEKENK